MRKTAFLFFLLLVFSVAIAQQESPPPGSKPQEEALPEEAQQQDWTKAFQAAESTFQSDNQPASIPMFQDLITQIVEQKVKRGLTQPEQSLLQRSLDYLGQAFFNEGQVDEARGVFLKLIEANPNYRVNEDVVSPKVVSFISQIRAENVGTISVVSDPKEAIVKLDGNEVGVTDLTGLFSLKGDHEIEISKPGYIAQTKAVTVVAQKTQKINVTLERSSSVGYFVTYPKGVELTMAGKSLGVTGGDVPSDRASRVATEQNLPVNDFSAEFPVSDLQPGTYEVDFKKPCFESQTRRFTIDKNDDYRFEPIVLAPSYAYINITADDPQANILIDNEYKGIAPKQKLQVCSGKRVLKIKGPRGKYEKELTLAKDQTVDINAKLNPSLAFLGIVGPSDVLQGDIDKLSAETVKQLSNLQNLNFVDNSGGADRQALNTSIQQIIDGISTNTPDKDRRARIQELCTKVESDLLLVGFSPKERLQRTVQFYLLSNWSSMADIRQVQAFDQQQWDTFRSQLEYEEPLFQKRLGVNLIDTNLAPGPIVAQILIKTFQDAQPLNPGDAIVAVNDKPVKNVADAQTALRALQSASSFTLGVKRGTSTMQVTITPVNSPMEIRFDNPSLLFNRQLVSFKKAMNISTNNVEKNVALLNIGLCLMHFGEYDAAFDQLRQIQLTRNPGIGQGTVQYRIAQCYRELGYLKEAQDTLQDASKYSQNTIYSDDGPPLSTEIKRAQSALQ
jgi:tetratricopeptide (TPR) repeat protein